MIKTRLIGLLSREKKHIAFIVLWQWLGLLSQIAAVCSVAFLLEQILFDTLHRDDVTHTLLILAVVILVRFLCEKMASRESFLACVKVKQVLREKIYQKLLRLGISYHTMTSTSEVVQVCTEGVEQLETYFGKYLPQLFYSLLAPLTLFIALSRYSLKASVVLLICVPLIPVSIVIVQKIAKRLLNQYWSIYTGLGDSFLENLQGLTTLKIYQADEEKAREMDRESQNFRRITMKVLTMQLNSTSVMDIIAYGGAAVGMIVVLREFFHGTVGFSGTLSIILLASEFFIPLRLLGSFFHIAMNGMAASDKIFRILDLPESAEGTQSFTTEGDHGKTIKPDITIRDLCFSYEANREILKDIHLEIPAGRFISLVGESGCGKSTLAGILSGRNHGYSGSVTIAGRELAEIREADLMRQVLLVRHNSYLFKGTVEENLRLAKPDAREEELVAVLKRTNLWGFLKEQEGLKTRLAEKGSNFSGGQCQRLAVARTLLSDARILIFDEATSNIDAESEELIMDVIHELAGEKTILLISHRLHNVLGSDCIYMMEAGRVREYGTHEELMANHGPYHRLYQSQRALETWTERSI